MIEPKMLDPAGRQAVKQSLWSHPAYHYANCTMTDKGQAELIRDASDVGLPCSICSHIDFLPFRCALCRRTFCKAHSSAAAQPAEHDCPNYKDTLVNEDDQVRNTTSVNFKSLLPGESVIEVMNAS